MADFFLQHLDAVGWTSGRASSMEEISVRQSPEVVLWKAYEHLD